MRWQTALFDELSTHQLYTVMRLRQEVFVVEQNCIYHDLDGLDIESGHILCWEDGNLLAYLRCLKPGLSYPQSSIGRIVVSPKARGRDLGRELVTRGIAYNFQEWPNSDIRIGAQRYLEAFYCGLGFVTDGEPYMEDGIEHVHMNLGAH
ncbi:MAG: GNAT family N-acetyltransferase [Proteobacteria bacterium]|nr:GNAT family N-acetyltransferase [Pseudomonadota bacterium]